MGNEAKLCGKRRISHISQDVVKTPIQFHEMVKMGGKRRCFSYKGLRYGDWPLKRVALGQITANQGRTSSTHESRWGCKQCDVPLCKERGCFEVFHDLGEN
jgi:hypothetical protein